MKGKTATAVLRGRTPTGRRFHRLCRGEACPKCPVSSFRASLAVSVTSERVNCGSSFANFCSLVFFSSSSFPPYALRYKPAVMPSPPIIGDPRCPADSQGRSERRKLPDFENNVIACRVIHRVAQATKRSFIKRSLTETRSRSFELLAFGLRRVYFARFFFRAFRCPIFLSLFFLSFRIPKCLLCRKVRLS